jgi:hypothetical protein
VIRSSRRRTSLALAALLTIAVWAAFPSSASADLYFSPFIALKFGGETTLLDVDAVAGSNDAADKAKKVTWGGGVMWLGSGVLGVEGEVAITPGYFQRDPSQVLSDAGLAYSRNLSAFNLGGGVIGMLSRRTGLRWDLRYLRGIGSGDGDTLTGGARLTYWRASMAVVIRTR